MGLTRCRIAALVGLAAIALAACGGRSQETGDEPAATAAAATSAGKTIEGRFDVGGHKLYIRCEGAGSPTVVYLHGYIWSGNGGAVSAGRVPSLLRDDHRICVYDRPNLGRSDRVRGPVSGRQTVRELHTLLGKAGVEPPYVLLGASFGGLLSYIYAATYPDDVKGMVLLDASFPGELALEPLWPKNERLTHDEWKEGAETLDELGVYQESQGLSGRLPAIPVTYLLATPSGWTGPPKYEAVVLKRMAKYVDGFSPGVLKRVRSPHYMEAAVPERIAREVDKLIAATSR